MASPELSDHLKWRTQVQMDAALGQSEAIQAFAQYYFEKMRGRASRVRPSGKCPWRFKLHSGKEPGLNHDILRQLWTEWGFTLVKDTAPRWRHYHLEEIPGFIAQNADQELWRDLMRSTYRTWHEALLDYWAKLITREISEVMVRWPNNSRWKIDNKYHVIPKEKFFDELIRPDLNLILHDKSITDVKYTLEGKKKYVVLTVTKN